MVCEGEEDERAPFGDTPMMSTSARLALAERELAEVIAQRDEALDELDAYRRDNAKLREELERARSYKALYAAAHEVINRFLGFVVLSSRSSGGGSGVKISPLPGDLFDQNLIVGVLLWGTLACRVSGFRIWPYIVEQLLYPAAYGSRR